ncbi:MAG TPA: sensor domain-containing diguanylate cyclase [Variovorax sp.]
MKRDVRLAKSLLLAVMVSVSAATGWQLWVARNQALAATDTSNLNLAKALNTYAEGIFTQSDMLLQGVAERLETDGDGPEHPQGVQSLVDRQQRLLNQLDGLAILDARGDWTMYSKGSVPAGTNSANRTYFVHHRGNPSHDIFIGSPLRNPFTGEWGITVSRRLDDAEGRFAGVVVIGLGLENFLRAFGTIDLGKSGTISLSTHSGQMLVRYPYREQDIGHDLSGSANFQRHSAEASGIASFRSSLDGTQRLYAFRKSDRYPVRTTVTLARNAALQAWRHQALLTLGVVGALLAAVAAVGWRLIINIGRRVSAEASLMAAREDLLQANRRLEVLATQDQLTGLANRRSFDEVLALESRRAARDGTALSLLLLDLDYFKRFNDAYGHVAGDQCLKAVAAALQRSIRRPGDLAARYGGEELAVILPDTDLPGARNVADMLLEHVQALDISHGSSPHGRVTVSIGVATLQGPQSRGAEQRLVEAADRALYRAKESGRNCSTSQEDPVDG